MQCFHRNTVIDDDCIFCTECGEAILECAKCHKPGKGKFCLDCGGALVRRADSQPAAAPATPAAAVLAQMQAEIAAQKKAAAKQAAQLKAEIAALKKAAAVKQAAPPPQMQVEVAAQKKDAAKQAAVKAEAAQAAEAAFARGEEKAAVLENIDSKDWDSVIADYTKAIELDPNNAKYYWTRGEVYHDRKGHYARAIADYTRAIELDPHNAHYYAARGRAYVGNGGPGDDIDGHYSRAIADFTRAIELDPIYTDSFKIDRGEAYSYKGDYDLAIADHTWVIERHPGYSAYYANRGRAYARKGDYDSAIADYTEALKVAKSNDSKRMYKRRIAELKKAAKKGK